ncbi:hypothetical protein HRJ34_18340 [Rhizorhabdus wittichii]|jgi:acyl CoA:acetate/3-ketoacid CoA transferase beta subunit|uniref:Uncharacterized protein n=1 Tax=Rhizorhabdus wittichii TaxID=160791 RepID=A0A975D116_9SPHN|nr:hypothetical protein [Rhizorhabdus wittichii]QTH20291.1 hypothetical protein HRJ34_18340 [Rhizorhabdus wittichii]
MSAADELFIITMARQMQDSDVLHIGASQFDLWQAAEVARRLHAPNLRMVAAGTYFLSPGIRGGADVMASRTYSRDVIAARQASFVQSRVFNDLHRTRVSFPGAMQVDVHGNANLIAIEANGRVIRGPGSGGLPTLTSHSERFFIALPRHDERALVEKVHRISVAGNRKLRESYGLPPCSLQQVITPIASFEQGWDGLELIETAPGIDSDEVQRRTGFTIVRHADCRERPPPTTEESSALADVRAGR